MNKLFFILATITLLLIPQKGIAFRDALAIRCGSKLVRNGASKIEVISKCGEPDLNESSATKTVGQFQSNTQTQGNRRSTTEGTFNAKSTEVEKWHYNCGGGRFIKTLTFEGGVLKSIQDGNRGTGPKKCS